MDVQQIQSLNERLARIEEILGALLSQRTQKDFYSTSETAVILGKAEFTVREWCRLGRVHAVKRACGRGRFQEWMISNEELRRFESEGLLPDPNARSRRAITGNPIIINRTGKSHPIAGSE